MICTHLRHWIVRKVLPFQIFLLTLTLLTPSWAQTSAHAQQTTKIRVVTRDEADKPVSSATIEVKKDGATVASGTTNESGEVELTNVPPGTYEISVSRNSFEPVSQPDVAVSTGSPVEIAFILVPKIELKDTVEVKAGADNKVEQVSSPGTTLERTVVKDITKPATVTDTLPLIPGVVRSTEGEIKISGSGEHRSALVVNSADVTDPATGQFGVTVPVDSVQSIEVFKTPYLAQFGRFTAGVVSVETRRGGEKWNLELNDPLPEWRIRSGHLRGTREASPRLTFNGPLIRGKLYLSEGLEYDLQKTEDKTLPFPFNETIQSSVNSFTQIDYILSPVSTLTGTFHVAPRQMEFVNLNFFNPQPVTPTFSAHDYTGTLINRWTIGPNLLESTLAVKRFTGNVWGQGTEDMILTPTGNQGNYFSQQNRNASRLEWLETYSLAPIQFYGSHNLKFGSTIAHTGNRGDFIARPIEIHDTDGLLLKRIDWVGGQAFDRTDVEIAVFA